MTTDEQYVVMVQRVLRALSRRAGDDLVTLAAMKALRDELDGHIVDAVSRQRHDPVWPASWRQIGKALGMKPQSAHEHYGEKARGLRRPGGQRGEWR